MREMSTVRRIASVSALIAGAAAWLLWASDAPRAQSAIAADPCPSTVVNEIAVATTGASYRAAGATATPTNFFVTGQNADTLVSGIDFDNAGGSQLFNHPSGIATDGTKVVLTDTFNNRVLIWNSPPASNVAPDVVLGQNNFTTNAPGAGRHQMNWPISVAVGSGKLFVSDGYNHRILIWNSIPTTNGAAADVVIDRSVLTTFGDPWPWGVWSDGVKLVVAATGVGRVLVWNTVPTIDGVAPSFTLDGRDGTNTARLGTPRHVTSNGSLLIVGDHNGTVPGKAQAGSFFWSAFPTSSTSPFSFFLEDPVDRQGGPWLKGTFIDSALWGFGRSLYTWTTPPVSESAPADLTLTGYDFGAGDYGGVAYAGGRLYVPSGNANRIYGFSSLPTTSGTTPDFAVGSPAPCTNTLDTNYFIQNGVPRSNGTNLLCRPISIGG